MSGGLREISMVRAFLLYVPTYWDNITASFTSVIVCCSSCDAEHRRSGIIFATPLGIARG